MSKTIKGSDVHKDNGTFSGSKVGLTPNGLTTNKKNLSSRNKNVKDSPKGTQKPKKAPTRGPAKTSIKGSRNKSLPGMSNIKVEREDILKYATFEELELLGESRNMGTLSYLSGKYITESDDLKEEEDDYSIILDDIENKHEFKIPTHIKVAIIMAFNDIRYESYKRGYNEGYDNAEETLRGR